MARRPPRSIAEKYRAHREAFLLAQELGCTPREAEAEIERREARARWKDSAARLAAVRHRPPPPISGADPEPPREPWWKKD